MQNNIQSMQEFYAIYMRLLAERKQWDFAVSNAGKGKVAKDGTGTESEE